MHSFMAFNCSSKQLVLKLGFFSTLYFSSGRKTCKDEATESMLGLEDKLSFWEGGLVQHISSVVGNVKGEGVDEFNRSQLFRKELVFPSHCTVQMSFCSRVLVSHYGHMTYVLSEGGEGTKATMCCMF